MDVYSLDEFKEQKVQIFASGRDFEVTNLNGRIHEAASVIESAIEARGNSCRIYTVGRVAAAATSILAGPWTAIAAAAGLAAHNLATFRPQFEIAKHLVDNKLTVKRLRH